MRYKGVIFDLDGVICSTDRYHYLAWKQLADRLGIPFEETVNDRLRGVSRMDSLDIILERSPILYTPDEKLALAAEKNDAYRALLSQMSPADLSDEVRNTLSALRQAGYRLAIGSSSRNAPFILERISLEDFFDSVSDGNNLLRSKPDPEVFLRAADMLSLQPEHCLVVEDAEVGVEAAVRGGFDCAAMGSAKDDLRATWHLKTFGDLMELIP